MRTCAFWRLIGLHAESQGHCGVVGCARPDLFKRGWAFESTIACTTLEVFFSGTMSVDMASPFPNHPHLYPADVSRISIQSAFLHSCCISSNDIYCFVGAAER